MKRIMYLYPRSQRVSFTVIGKEYVKVLRSVGYDVVENDLANPTIPEEDFDVCIVHPITYIMLKYPRTFRRILARCGEWIGFDVCDSDHISPLASYAISWFDRVAVPSRFCARVFDKSAVTSKIYVVPHHLKDVFYRDNVRVNNDFIEWLRSVDKPKFLFFLWHSFQRKGADVLAEAWGTIAEKIDALLIVKTSGHPDPFIPAMEALPKTVVWDAWLSDEELVALYDAVDVVVVPSRGGAFELNALEALARGKIVITSEWYPIQEYCKICLKVKSRGKCRVFPSNSVEGMIHDGYGVDPDPYHLALLIYDVYLHLDEYRKKFEEFKHWIRKEYSFEKVKKALIDFVEGR